MILFRFLPYLTYFCRHKTWYTSTHIRSRLYILWLFHINIIVLFVLYYAVAVAISMLHLKHFKVVICEYDANQTEKRRYLFISTQYNFKIFEQRASSSFISDAADVACCTTFCTYFFLFLHFLCFIIIMCCVWRCNLMQIGFEFGPI